MVVYLPVYSTPTPSPRPRRRPPPASWSTQPALADDPTSDQLQGPPSLPRALLASAPGVGTGGIGPVRRTLDQRHDSASRARYARRALVDEVLDGFRDIPDMVLSLLSRDTRSLAGPSAPTSHERVRRWLITAIARSVIFSRSVPSSTCGCSKGNMSAAPMSTACRSAAAVASVNSPLRTERSSTCAI